MAKCEMLINSVPGEECRIAVVVDGRLEEIYQERANAESHVGNIYHGKVVNIEPSIQAAFVEFGLERNGFLHITDLHPMYFPGDSKEDLENVGRKISRRDRPPIQQALRRGQDILVQILKEGIGTKGPTLTSYLSIPGRLLVMMPHMQRLGVSRKIENDQTRRELRKLLSELKPPPDFGFIVRTAGIGRTKLDLKRDLSYLQRLWSSIEKRRSLSSQVGELYAESDLVVRTIRDVFSADIDRIIVDDPAAGQRAKDFLAIASPRSSSKVMIYREPIPLFRRFGIEQQIENIHRRTVELQSGGSLVIDSAEALVAIDVNSGKMRGSQDAESTAFEVNKEASDEICRQLRLRDLGGVIVMDLIDMMEAKHRRSIEQQIRQNLRRDRARTRVGTISQFGILEMTRQRMRPSLSRSTFMDCPACEGTGVVKSPESVLLDLMRRLATVLHQSRISHVELTISPDVAFQLLNRKRADLVELEKRHNKRVVVRVNDHGPIDEIQLVAHDAKERKIDAESARIGGVPTLEAIEASDRDELFDEDGPSESEQEHSDTKAKQTEEDESQGSKPRRRRRRGGKKRSNASTSGDGANASGTAVTANTPQKEQAVKAPTSSQPRSRRRSTKVKPANIDSDTKDEKKT